MIRVTKKTWLIVVTLAALAAVLSPSSLAASRQLAVTLDEPFEVMGHQFESGELELREISTYSPVATLNEIRVNGESIGVVVGRDELGPLVSDRDQLVFTRSDAGHLVLDSVAFSGETARHLQPIGETTPAVTGVLVSQR